MDKIRNLSPGKKALLLASGITCASVGAYAIYKILKKEDKDLGHAPPPAPTSPTTPPTKPIRQPSENLDYSDYAEHHISESGKRVLVLGLEKSGKSCLLAALSSEDEPKVYAPTKGFNVVCIGTTHLGPRLDIMEVGGSGKYKDYWGSFVKGINVLMYVIDSCDVENLPDSLNALAAILQMKELDNVPVVIVFSKRDNTNALPLESMMVHFEAERFENRSFQYNSVQVKSGGAPSTEGVNELQETIQNLQ